MPGLLEGDVTRGDEMMDGANRSRCGNFILALFVTAVFWVATVAPAAAWSAAEMNKAQADGVHWLRTDLFPGSRDGDSQNYVNAAQARGIQVIGILGSNAFEPYVSFWYSCGWWSWCYYDWGLEWQKYVRTVVNENKHWVKDWQCGNELNHPGHNSYPAFNKQLRKDIVRICVD